jgi:hypothetical protein
VQSVADLELFVKALQYNISVVDVESRDPHKIPVHGIGCTVEDDVLMTLRVGECCTLVFDAAATTDYEVAVAFHAALPLFEGSTMLLGRDGRFFPYFPDTRTPEQRAAALEAKHRARPTMSHEEILDKRRIGPQVAAARFILPTDREWQQCDSKAGV